jgi:hypothetical protein
MGGACDLHEASASFETRFSGAPQDEACCGLQYPNAPHPEEARRAVSKDARCACNPPSPLDLPGRGGVAIGIFAILELDAHGEQLIADAVGFGEVFLTTGFEAGGD